MNVIINYDQYVEDRKKIFVWNGLFYNKRVQQSCGLIY